MINKMSMWRPIARHTLTLMAIIGLMLALGLSQLAVAGLPHMTLDDRPLMDALTAIKHRPYGLTGRGTASDIRVVRAMNEDCTVLNTVNLTALRCVVRRHYMSIDGNGMFDLGCYLPHASNHASICILTTEHGYVVTLEEIYDTGTRGDSFSRYIIPDKRLADNLVALYTTTVFHKRIRTGQIEFETVDKPSASDSFLYTEEMELQRKH